MAPHCVRAGCRGGGGGSRRVVHISCACVGVCFTRADSQRTVGRYCWCCLLWCCLLLAAHPASGPHQQGGSSGSACGSSLLIMPLPAAPNWPCPNSHSPPSHPASQARPQRPLGRGRWPPSVGVWGHALTALNPLGQGTRRRLLHPLERPPPVKAAMPSVLLTTMLFTFASARSDISFLSLGRSNAAGRKHHVSGRVI